MTERVVLLPPADGLPASVRLIAGLYDPATGERLTIPDGQDAVSLTVWP